MKRNIKFYTVAEEGNFELADIIQLDIKRNGNVRNIHKLKLNNKSKEILGLDKAVEDFGLEEMDNDFIQSLLSQIINHFFFLLREGDISIFKNIKYNIHPEKEDSSNGYERNALSTFGPDNGAVSHYFNQCKYDMMPILFNTDVYDCYKLHNIDCLAFTWEKQINDANSIKLKEEFCNDIRFDNALKEVYPNLTKGEYSLIKKRFSVLVDIFYLYNNDEDSPYKKVIEECKIFPEDDIIERFKKLTPFHNLIKTR
jgi:hypothetical protein